MLRTTISKLRQVCALTFVPRLLRGDALYTSERFKKLSVCVQRRVDKSTSSGKDSDKEDHERCQRIIDRAFSPPDSDVVDMDAKHKENIVKMITPEAPTPPESQCEKCQRLIKQIFGEEDAGDMNKETVDPVRIPMTELQATTAKDTPETLTQKVEHIEETPLVEAPSRSKIEGFNMPPKVLGKKKRRIGDRISVLSCSCDKSNQGRRKGVNKKEGSLDEIAKRCLESPSGNIDERLLKEMEKLGVPPTGRRSSRRTSHDAGIVQPEIMKRPRRPVAKPELDFMNIRRRDYLRLNSGLPPPFELTPVKDDSINLVSFDETNHGVLYYERLPPFKESETCLADKANTLTTNPDSLTEMTDATSRPPQTLLGQLTATVMSNDSNIIKGNNGEIEQLVDKKEQDSLEERLDEKISLLKLKEFENRHDQLLSQERLASTHLLKDIVDPKEISPRSHSPGMVKEEIDMLKYLLRTRVEYLTQESVRKLHHVEDSKETPSQIDRVVMREFTESEVDDTLQRLGVEPLKVEKVKQQHAKEDLIPTDVTSFTGPGVVVRECTGAAPLQKLEPGSLKNDAQNPLEIEKVKQQHAKEDLIPTDVTSFTGPGVVIRECTGAEPLQQPEPILLKSYSLKEEMVTPHKLFEQLSLLSRETEIGVIMDDINEKDPNTDSVRTDKVQTTKQTPKNATLGQLIDHDGVAPKDDTSTGPVGTKGPHITLTQMLDHPTDELLKNSNHNLENDRVHNIRGDSNIAIDETSSFEGLGVVIRECTEAQPQKEGEQTKSNTHKHLEESMKQAPKSSTAGQLLDKAGIVSKGADTPKENSPPVTFVKDSYRPLIDPYDKKFHNSQEYELDSYQILNSTPKEVMYNDYKLSQEKTIQSFREDRPLYEEPEEPVTAVEMSRLSNFDRKQLIDYQVISSATEPVTSEVSNSADVTREMPMNPLLDRGTVGSVAADKLNADMTTETIPADINSVNAPRPNFAEKPMKLSQLLKRARERNRLELLREYQVQMSSPQVDPVIGECGKKVPPCPPPAPKCPPPPEKPCPPKKPPCPNPCKPKCPPTCPPAKCDPKPSCPPPPKKSPCEKFKKCSCSSVQIQDALTLLLYLGPQFHIPRKYLLPLLACTCNNLNLPKAESGATDYKLASLHNLCTIALVTSVKNGVNKMESLADDGKDYAKTYEPWSPIPSWPIPVKEEKKKLVCPKEGCKVIPPKLNAPCRDVNPCLNFPKKHFSIIDFFRATLGRKVVYDIGDF